jgi:hypothetical protein
MSDARALAVRAAAVLRVARQGKAWPKIRAEIELGKAYTRALRLYPRYKRAVEWAFADNWKPTSASAAIDRWWPSDGPPPESIIVLAGPGGNGKTSAAIRLLVREGGSIIAAKDFHELPLGEAGDARLSALAREPLVVLENAGKESPIGPTVERIGRLIDDLYERKGQLIITTNLQRDGLDDHGRRDPKVKDSEIFSGRYAEDLLDRIDGDDGWCEIEDPSMRGGEKAQLVAATRGARLAELFESAEAIRTGHLLGARPLDELVALLKIPEDVIAAASEAIALAPVRALEGVEMEGVIGSILDRWRA